MTKALLKKQIREVFSWLFVNKKSGSRRSRGKIVLFSLLYGLLFLYLAGMFFLMAYGICEPLSSMGYGWFYFLIVSLVGIVFGVAGSVFNTYASLYAAKDNDLLLSLPIPAPKILFARLSGVYVMGLMYELVVMIPALIVWFIYGSYNLLGGIFSILLPVVISFFVLTLSCVLGWVVALIAARVKSKSLVTVLIALAVMVLYFIGYYKVYDIISNMLINAEEIANSAKSILYPFYQMGLAAEGNVLAMLIFTSIVAVLFLVAYAILSHSFFKLATKSKSTHRLYKRQDLKHKSSSLALFKKEAKRFLASPTYILNCSLGSVFMIAGAVFLLIKSSDIYSIATLILGGRAETLPLLALACICTIGSMNDITAPSVSLEGKSIWIIQSLPVSPFNALLAKLYLHLSLTLPPYLFLAAVAAFVLKIPFGYAALTLFVALVFALLMALFGLFMNLLAPNLKWINETVPVKQSLSVTVTLFGGWGIAAIFSLIYILVDSFISPLLYLVLLGVIFAAASVLIFIWLKKRGARIFATL